MTVGNFKCNHSGYNGVVKKRQIFKKSSRIECRRKLNQIKYILNSTPEQDRQQLMFVTKFQAFAYFDGKSVLLQTF